MGGVEALARFVEDEQAGLLDERSRQQNHSLQASRYGKERSPGICEELKAFEAPARCGPLASRGRLEQSHCVMEAGGDDFKAGRRGVEVEVQLRGDPADVPLDVPDGFTAAALAAKEDDVVGIDLRVVAEDGLNSLSGGILSHTHTSEVRVSVSGCWGVSPREIPLRPIPS
jgi:hypothetical protein